jgi:hypothetical protein
MTARGALSTPSGTTYCSEPYSEDSGRSSMIWATSACASCRAIGLEVRRMRIESESEFTHGVEQTWWPKLKPSTLACAPSETRRLFHATG